MRSVYGILLKSEEETKWSFLPLLLFKSTGFIILAITCVLSHPYKCYWTKNHLGDKGKSPSISLRPFQRWGKTHLNVGDTTLCAESLDGIREERKTGEVRASIPLSVPGRHEELQAQVPSTPDKTSPSSKLTKELNQLLSEAPAKESLSPAEDFLPKLNLNPFFFSDYPSLEISLS